MNDKMKVAILYRYLRILAIFILLYTGIGHGSVLMAQSNIGISSNGAVPDPSALLDINAAYTGNQGLLIPRLTTVQRNNLATSCSCTPAQSLLIFNTSDSCFETYLGNSWRSFWCATGTCSTPIAPTAGTNTATTSQITWNWNTVEGATLYQWNTSNTYPGSGTNTVTSASYTQTGLSCGTPYTLYVWSYNPCGYSISSVTLTQSTSSACGPSCGGQVWADSNLVLYPISTYQNFWSGANNPQPSGVEWCWNDVAANCALVGGLFDWNNATQLAAGSGSGLPSMCNPCGTGGIQGLCPANYHIPTDLEWSQYEYCVESTIAPTGTTTLVMFQTGTGYRGSIWNTSGVYWGPGAKLQSTNTANSLGGWTSTAPIVGNNLSGFNAVGGGYINNSYPYKDGTGGYAFFWTATEFSSGSAFNRQLTAVHGTSSRSHLAEQQGMSIRCLHN